MSDQMYVLAVALGAVYLAPAAIAWFRFHPHAAGIAALNVLLGWTFVGWVFYHRPTTGLCQITLDKGAGLGQSHLRLRV